MLPELRCRVVARGVTECRLEVVGEVDLASASGLRSFVLGEVGRTPTGGVIVLDLAGVGFFSAAGVKELVSARRYARRRGVALVVHPVSTAVDLVLVICGVHDELGVPQVR